MPYFGACALLDVRMCVVLRAIAVMKARSPTDIVYQLTYVDHPLLIITHILSCGVTSASTSTRVLLSSSYCNIAVALRPA